jgi:competence protein ComEC
MLMISHGDNDHAGGATAVAREFPQATRYAGEPARMRIPMHQCVAGQSWRWDGVRFRVLSPAAGAGDRDNDSSCVLLVEGRGGSILLTGDISSMVEPQVAAALGPGPSPILLVPHHGSKTSSSAAFIAAVRPPLALVSAGWHNHFGHPKPEVLARYAQAHVPVVDTAEQGAIPLEFPAGGPPLRRPGWRAQQPRYWRE